MNLVAPIQYVFVLMQENRSFDNYFGRFQDYLKDLHRTDARVGKYVDQESRVGVDVPGKPYGLRDDCDKQQQDAKLDGSYDPRSDAPFNPTGPGVDPPDAKSKHYWTHAAPNDALQQCLSDTCHEWWCMHLEWDSGRMDGFWAANKNYREGGEPIAPSAAALSGDRAMLYYDQTDVPFYYWLADHFALGDHYFSAMLGPTWPNRDYLYGATSRGLTSNYGFDYAISPFPGLYAKDVAPNPPQPNGMSTIYDPLTAAGIKYIQWVRDRYSNVVAPARWSTWYGSQGIPAPNTKFTYDAASFGGPGFEATVAAENDFIVTGLSNSVVPRLPPVNFLDSSSLEDVNGEDEHPPAVPQMGQRFVYDVVRVLMSNPEVWKRSVLFVTYDEAGGFYDHVDPPKACTPDNIDPSFDGGAYGVLTGDSSDAHYGGHFDRYGVRVPLLVISPWVNHGYVSHYTYDHTSVVRFVETRFKLAALTRRDGNADPLLDFFDFSDAERKLAGAIPGWGQEQLEGSFPSTPSAPAKGDAPAPTLAAAADVATYGAPLANRAEKYLMTAPVECVAAYPTDDAPSEVSNVLGKYIYPPKEWTPGQDPPTGYDSQKSQPFPTRAAQSPPANPTNACSPDPGTGGACVLASPSGKCTTPGLQWDCNGACCDQGSYYCPSTGQCYSNMADARTACATTNAACVQCYPDCGVGVPSQYSGCGSPEPGVIPACKSGEYECMDSGKCYPTAAAALQDCAPLTCVPCH